MADRRYRILFVCAHPVQYMSPLLRRMSEHPQIDLQTAYCTLRGAKAGHDPEFGTTIQWDIPLLDGYPWIEVPNKGDGSEGFWGLYNPGLWKLVRQGDFDAVFCPTGYIRATFWLVWFACLLSRSAFIFGTDAHKLGPRDGKRWKKPVKHLIWPILYRFASQVLAPSTGTRNMLLALGIPEDRITLVPYVVDNDWWAEQSARINRDVVRASWGATPETSVILYCAKMQAWKRPLDLVRAFAQANLEDSLLVLAGEGPLRASLEAECDRLKITDRVRFLGFANQTQLPAIYTAADLLVLPSEYDAFGVVINEAMICGCLAAASDNVGASQDLIRPVDPALIYKTGDVAALAEVLKYIFADPDRLAKLRVSARKRMESWSPKEYVLAILDMVGRSVSRIRPPR